MMVRAGREAGLVLVILAVAAIVRLHDLTVFPSGLHGDEAITGLEGRRILEERWIGPYSDLALGQPTGPLYLTAMSVWIFGSTVLAVRLVPALLSLLTVLAFYVLLRRNLGSQVAVIGMALLAVMSWHVHYGRIGFPLSAWPLVVIVAVGAVMEALRTGQMRWWAAAGATAGLGLYAYHAHTVFLGILMLFILHRLYGWVAVGAVGALGLYALAPNPLTLSVLTLALLLLLTSSRLRNQQPLASLAAYSGAFGIIALPMARFAADPANRYFEHAQIVSIFNREDWTTLASTGERLALLIERYVGYWRRLCCDAQPDLVDATGVTPIVPVAMLLLAVAGLWRWRQSPLMTLGLLVLVAMPWASVVTVDGLARRTFVIAPFLALFAAVGIADLLRLGFRQRPVLGLPLMVMVLVVTSIAVYHNVANEFGKVRGSPEEHWVFAREITDAALFMRTLPADHHVYFFADRWSADYETRQFLAPEISAEDRSTEFGELSLEVDLDQGQPVFVFVGTYRDLAGIVSLIYPDGRTVVGGAEDEPTFIAYLPATDSRG